MAKEQLCVYIGFDREPKDIEEVLKENKFIYWTPKKGPDKEARARWRYVDCGDGIHNPTGAHIYGIYQQTPNIQEEFIPEDFRSFAAIIMFKANANLIPGSNDKRFLEEKIEQTVNALLLKYASIGATRYTQEDVGCRSTA